MTLDRIRTICMGFPHVTEQVQWGDDLVFKVGGKMFAVARLDMGSGKTVPNALAFKVSPEDFTVLPEREGIIPAPYMARSQWVALASFDALGSKELGQRLRHSYDLVLAKLPKKLRENL